MNKHLNNIRLPLLEILQLSQKMTRENSALLEMSSAKENKCNK